MSWIDRFFVGIATVLVNGTAVPQRGGMNLVNGTGVTIVGADNQALDRTDITISAAGGGASTTGTGLWYSAAGALNAAAVSLSGDVSPGALSGANLPLTVTGLQGHALPAVATGVLQYSAGWSLAAVGTASLSPGTSGQIMMSNATPAATWATMSVDGTISSTGALTITQVRSGLVSWAAGTGVQSWLSTSTASMIQASTAIVTQGANLTITPQQSTQATNQGGGNLVVALQAPLGTGTEALVQMQRGGSNRIQFGADPVAPNYGGFWFGAITPSGSNFAILGDGASQLAINATGLLNLESSSTIQLSLASSGVQIGGSLTGTATDLGSGVGVLGIQLASTVPSSNPATSGNVVMWSGAGGLTVRAHLGAITTIAAQGSSLTVAGQAQVYDEFWGTCTTTATATATTVGTYSTPTGTSGMINIVLVTVCTSAGTGSAVGDTITSNWVCGYKNVAGTVAIPTASSPALVGSAQVIPTTTTTVSALTATVATNVVTFKVANLATGNYKSQIFGSVVQC